MRAACAAALLVAATLAQAEPFEFKGVPFGSTTAALIGAHPTFSCFPAGAEPGITSCATGLELCRGDKYGCGPANFAASKYADERVDMIVATFVDGTFERLEVYFPTASFDGINSALLEKLGRPKSALKIPYATVGGVKTTNDSNMWEVGGNEVMIERYGRSLAQGHMFVVSPKYRATNDAREAGRKAQRSKGM